MVNPPGDQEYAAFLLDFQHKTKSCRETLHAQLKIAAETGIPQPEAAVAEALAVWEKAIRELPGKGATTLEFHLFKMPFSELLIEGLGLRNVVSSETSMPNTVLGVLK
jgi:hypothetical protein